MSLHVPEPIRITRVANLGRADFPALGTAVCVFTADPTRVAGASLEVQQELAAVDAACGRLRADTELEVANRAGGHQVAVGPLLAEAIDSALRAARLTDGALDPAAGPGSSGWAAVHFNRDWGTLQMPPAVRLDLSDTASALAADRAAARAAEATGQGVLVSLGMDIAAGGPAPAGGWNITVANRSGGGGPVMHLESGGVSSVAGSAEPDGWPGWRTVSVAAGSCLDARIAAAGALARGGEAPAWLTAQGYTARLVAPDGSVTLVGRWETTEVAA